MRSIGPRLLFATATALYCIEDSKPSGTKTKSQIDRNPESKSEIEIESTALEERSECIKRGSHAKARLLLRPIEPPKPQESPLGKRHIPGMLTSTLSYQLLAHLFPCLIHLWHHEDVGKQDSRVQVVSPDGLHGHLRHIVRVLHVRDKKHGIISFGEEQTLIVVADILHVQEVQT